MTRISKQSIELIQKRTEADVAQWLAQGLLNIVREVEFDPFAPHSFVHLAGHPVEGIESLYSQAPLPLKLGLRKGIAMLGPLCLAKSVDAEDLSKPQRLALLQEFLRLSGATRCFEACKSIALIACSDEAWWGEEQFREAIYPLCVNCLEGIALGFRDSAFSIDASAPGEIEDALRRVARAPAFRAQYAPRMLASLINATPHNFVDHMRLLSVSMSALHRHDPMELELAYKTAHRLVDSALDQLADHFPKLDIAHPSSPDRWLVDALFATVGPLRYYRDTENAIVVYPSNNNPAQRLFTHRDLYRVDLPASTFPQVVASPRANEVIGPYSEKAPAFWNSKNKIHITYTPKRPN